MHGESERVDVSRNTVAEYRQDRAHLIQPFPHPVPLDLKSVAVVDDMPETAEGAELAGLRVVEQRGQRQLFGRTEPFELVQVPTLASRLFDAMKATQAFEDVFDARVELSEERRRRRLLAHRRLTTCHIPPQRFEFMRDLLQRVELDRDFGFQFFGRHKSTRARFSMSRVNGVGGSSGTKSSGTPRVSSSADANSKSFQPGTPAQARSRSRAAAGLSSPLPKSSSRLAPNWRATLMAFVSILSRSLMSRRLSLQPRPDNARFSVRLNIQP